MIIRQARSGISGFGGLDLPGCIALLARRGHDPDILALLLPAWEQGLLRAAELNRPRKDT
ncbi:DUF7697 family protein [Roseivivax isoporae]|uniref:Uncharacterized protein n=1 Tax=Roseivivax isoporae LMG 25204 TaxID=1449351 RepID=X7F237_9RHOB|nr:hypothetical protein [Roseivivax isoporae]ETX26850.1 hypothetical protein RISW2_18820 [Roseivivax isoporae LMG 25204]